MSKPVLVLSAHCDDGILSAGQFIAGRLDNVDVLTVFSGVPEDRELITDYDKKCGFDTSRDAMVVRQQEDTEACAILNAHPIYTDLLDSQYMTRQKGIADIIKRQVNAKDYEMIVAPLGLRHEDHIAVSNAVTQLKLKNLYLYEDLPARVQFPELVTERLRAFPTAELTFIGDGPIADKVRSLWCYRSQMNTGDLDPYLLYVPERFWKV